MLRTDNDATNLPQIRGTGEEHLRYFIENRLNYCDSKWYAGSYPEDNAVVRIYTPVDENGVPLTDLAIPANANITVTPYSNMYAGVRYKANGTLMQERLEANETYTFVAPNETFNDTETAIYGASQLSSLGDLAPLYLGYIDVGAATKLVELKIGDGTEGYKNANLYHLAVGTNRLLKKIDIQNCDSPRFVQALILTGCPNIEEVYAKGSSITGVELPDSGYLKILQLPSTITNLTLKNQFYIEDLTIEGLDRLKTLTIENTPVDTLSILSNAVNVERVRLTDVDWHYDDASILYELINRDIGGIDENGTNTDTMWIDGKCHIEYLTGDEYAEIKRLYPYLDITYTTLESQLIYMSEDGTTELHRETILNGGNGTDPVANGTIDTPTKESTAQYDFTFGGWSLTPGGDPNANALVAVEADRTVYVAFNKTVRKYTVRFINVTDTIETIEVEYGSDATYSGTTPVHPTEPDYHSFIGWKPEPTNITGNTDCYAQYYDNREITDDWATIEAACLDGTATEKYAIGAYKPVEITHEDGTVETINMEIIAHNHDELTDGVNKWEKLGSIPVSMIFANAVEYGGKLHLLNGTKHFTYDGSVWTEIGTFPVARNQCKLVLYNNEIYTISGNKGEKGSLYKYNGSEWSFVVDLPCVPGSANGHFVLDGEFYIFSHYATSYGSDLYKWNSVEWTKVTSTPNYASLVGDYTYAIVYNGEVHMFNGNNTVLKHRKWTGSEFVTICDLPEKTSYPLVYEGEFYINTKSKLYKFVNNEWIEVCESNIGIPVVYNHEIHLLGGVDYGEHKNTHYKWSTAGWESTADSLITSMSAPYVFEYNNDLYACYNKNVGFVLSKLDEDEWVDITDLPISPTSIGLYKNELYIHQATVDSSAEYYRKVYKYNWSDWVEAPDFPNHLGHMTFIEYDDCLHAIGGTYTGDNHYKFDGSSWIQLAACPTGGYVVQAHVYNNGIHVFKDANHYTWNGSEWVTNDELEISFTNNYSETTSRSAIVNNKLYLINGDTTILSWDGFEWSTVSNPFSSLRGRRLVTFRGRLHLVGASNDANQHYVLRNPRATLTFLAQNLLKDDMQMNATEKTYRDITGYNAGGWSNTDLRTYLNNTFYEKLPGDLKLSIKDIMKLSDNGKYKEIVQTNDRIFIPSVEEIGLNGVNSTIAYGLTAYSIFTDNLSRIKYKTDATAHTWYNRNSNINTNDEFLVNETTGLVNHWYSGDLYASILFGFCI